MDNISSNKNIKNLPHGHTLNRDIHWLKRKSISTKPLGQILVDIGAISTHDLLRAIKMQSREEVYLGEILLAQNKITETVLYEAIARQFETKLAHFPSPPDTRLIDRFGAHKCLRHNIIPWQRVGGVTIIATSHPDKFSDILPELTSIFGAVKMAIQPKQKIEYFLTEYRHKQLIEEAELRIEEEKSCRGINQYKTNCIIGAIFLAIFASLISFPQTTVTLLLSWVLIALSATTGLKIAAIIAQRSPKKPKGRQLADKSLVYKLPVISIMVPIFKEEKVINKLIKRLSLLKYPKELLDVCLIVEAEDSLTIAALEKINLPQWARTIIVPNGTIKTKPRALNYAFNFCRGSIIGVYDAEDAPEPDQIYKVARHFQRADKDVACIQGILSFYNSKTNWLARCFSIEYATWWRIIMPGFSKLGLTVPLGGTTLFFRRDILEKIGCWDAHNVTEDADLGVRLAREGYRTELIETVTNEEANCHLWPWIKQRSRWIKGYAITYAVHMRTPLKMIKEIGVWRFFGFQVLFLGALSQITLAPILWSFWLLPFGIPHPLSNLLGTPILIALIALFLIAEIATLSASFIALAEAKKRSLWPWVPSLILYYPLATFAAFKGLSEILFKPFYWDKTAHGLHDEEHDINDGFKISASNEKFFTQKNSNTIAYHPPQALEKQDSKENA